ncbi:MAG: thioredoxin-disulfide reductase [Anaerolineales bacterium]|nr:thioredoxin-disulfide reductase [Anaerolineales bacterium]MCB0004807.1 thioredoxin-disulfide reductase [Anaerolineales bacterium]MCB0027182.1 thioredoxin-disulfide reductase [Anaerolineales bacterium]MCB8958803.1 thioredoxin-disulfide reductase [Ardenticatenales bacterium]
MQKEKIVIIGSGPAGMTAALYAGRSNLEPVVIAGMVIGGQISITAEVENYIGFPEGTTGPELVEKMQKHAEHFGARFVFDEVTEVDFSKGSPFYVKTHGEEYLADSVIITAGASARLLEVPGEKELTGRGVSYCATCDGFFFRGKEVVVVGGGDSALEEGIFLTKFANTVTIIHRRDELRAGNFLQERAHANPKIKFIWDTVVEEIKGSAAVESITLRNRKTDEVSEMKVDGVFVFIGHFPNSQFLVGQVELDEQNFVITDELMRTSVPGVFAAGEIQDPIYKQIATSVGQGTAAAMQAEKWLSEREDEAALQHAS